MSGGMSTRRRGWLAAAIVVAVVGVVVWLAARDSDSEPTQTTPTQAAPTDATPTEGASTEAAPTETTEPVPSESLSPGSRETVPVEPAETKPAVALDATSSFSRGLVARVTDIEAVNGEARGPGEVAGPALRVAVEIRNDTGRAESLAGTVVTVAYGRDPAPGVSLSGPGVRPLAGSVPAGGAATGRYVFGVPLDQRDKIQVTISLRASLPTVVFEGSAPA
jgi:hypothetical protein